MLSTTLTTLAMAVAAIAAPTPASDSASSSNVVTFGLRMSVYNGVETKNLTLLALSLEDGDLEFVGHDDPKLGTAFFATGVNPNKTISTYYYNANFTLYTPENGDDTGTATIVSAGRDFEDPNWTIGNGIVEHKAGAATDYMMACNKTVNGEIKSVLSFGSTSREQKYPPGCDITTVYTF